jgi:hypothetical protein
MDPTAETDRRALRRHRHQRGAQGPLHRVSVERFLREVFGFLGVARRWSPDTLSGVSAGGISANNVNRVGRLRAAHQREAQGPLTGVPVERFLGKVIRFTGWGGPGA